MKERPGLRSRGWVQRRLRCAAHWKALLRCGGVGGYRSGVSGEQTEWVMLGKVRPRLRIVNAGF